MRPIVCALDDSESSRAALETARWLSGRLDARLVLIHVEPPTEAPGVSAAAAGQARLHEAEARDARDLLSRIAGDADLGEDVELRAEIGDAAERIVAACQELDAALVVVGSRGRGDLASAVLGSVSHAVAGRAPCPVVIVPAQAVRRTVD